MKLTTAGARVLAASATILTLLPLLVAAPSSAAPSQAELERAKDRLRTLERDFQLTSERFNLVAMQLESLQAQIGAAARDADVLHQRIDESQDKAIEVARALYKGGSSMQLETLLTAESIGDLDTRVQYLAVSRSEQTEVFQSLSADRTSLEDRVAELEVASEKVASKRAQLTALRAEANAKVAEQSDEIARLNRLIQRAQARQLARYASGVGLSKGISLEPNPAPATNPAAQSAVDAALSQLGKPYVWAAAGPDTYDCSGLTLWAWNHAGVELPHYSGAQFDITTKIERSDIEPGDLIFFGAPIHHVGMYIGNAQMVEAPYTGSVVRINHAFRSDLVGIGRPE